MPTCCSVKGRPAGRRGNGLAGGRAGAIVPIDHRTVEKPQVSQDDVWRREGVRLLRPNSIEANKRPFPFVPTQQV